MYIDVKSRIKLCNIWFILSSVRNYWTLFSLVTVRLNFKDIEFPNEIRFAPIINNLHATKLNFLNEWSSTFTNSVSYFTCKSLFIKRTVKRSVSLSLLLTSIFWSIKFTFIFYFIPLIYSQYSRSRPLNNRCPENWFVTLYLHIYMHSPSLSFSHSLLPPFLPVPPSLSLSLSPFLSACIRRDVEFTPRFVWRRACSLHVIPSRYILPHVSADICFIVFHVLFEINNTPASVPFFSYFIRRERGTGGSSLHSISHTRACLSWVQQEQYYMFSTILDKQSVKYLERLFLSSFD